MRWSKPFALPLLALTLILTPSSDARACTCAGDQGFVAAFDASDAVFLGDVLSIENAGPDYYPTAVWVLFRVDKSWKGEPPLTTRLLTAGSGVSCGFTFVPGTRYLVYAYRGVEGWGPGPDPDALQTNLCARTHAYRPDDPDLGALDWTGSVGFLAPYPSPSTGEVAFDYSLGAEGSVELAIYDLSGRQVRVLFERDAQAPGPHHRVWDGRDRSGRSARAGVYIAVLTMDGMRLHRRFALLR